MTLTFKRVGRGLLSFLLIINCIVALTINTKAANIYKVNSISYNNTITSKPIKSSLKKRIKRELGGEIISKNEIPKGVIPLEFDSIQEAKRYLLAQDKKLRIILNTGNVINSKQLNSNTQVATAKCKSKWGSWVESITINANYTYKKKKYTKCNSVSSYNSGLLSFGNSWVQDDYSSEILNDGKKLRVYVYGHFDHYLLINSNYTKISSSTQRKLKAVWKMS